MLIGVLAIHGSFIEHINMIKKLGQKTKEVRNKKDVPDIDALIIPGGESTVIDKELTKSGLDRLIIEKANRGMPIYGTCAGAIILANKIQHACGVKGLKLIDIEIDRNSYGSQLDSFEIALPNKISSTPLLGVFIRAPRILQCGKNVQVLAKYKEDIVFAREKNILVSTFHPELTDDSTVHSYFLDLIK